jgi:AcrR family transcriptional regulator
LKKTKQGNPGLTREEWVQAARRTLIKRGFAAVKIDRMARELDVTRGGFYWRFDGVDDLLNSLIEDWKKTNTQPLLDILNAPGSPEERYRKMQLTFIEEKHFNPEYDTAMREWARVSPKVAKVVHAVDAERIDALQALFAEAGYSEEEAFIRARITYLHQAGYYAMAIRETQKRRFDLSQTYYEVLTGFQFPEGGGADQAPAKKSASRATRAKGKQPRARRRSA